MAFSTRRPAASGVAAVANEVRVAGPPGEPAVYYDAPAAVPVRAVLQVKPVGGHRDLPVLRLRPAA
jgi:hypothetical protein